VTNESAASQLRVRKRRGRARIRRGIAYADPEGTLSLLPNAALGEWLNDVRDAFSGDLLDAGAGNQPYRPWYEPLVKSVVAVDATPAPGLAALALVDRLPFANESFDTVLSTEVWEHVEDVGAAARETMRVLRPGGRLIITVPFLYPTHEAPYDFGRFTHFGLRSALVRAGFEVERLDSRGGPMLWATHLGFVAFIQALDAAGRAVRLPSPPTSWRVLRWIIAAPQLAAISLRYRLRGVRRGVGRGAEKISLGYLAVAKKPEQ
jgi:SAM-dependent methyltransferase